MKITVTQDMIDKAVELNKEYLKSTCCPITLAVMETCAIEKLGIVDTVYSGVYFNGKVKFQVTKKMESFIDEFDFDGTAKPTTFQLRKIK